LYNNLAGARTGFGSWRGSLLGDDDGGGCEDGLHGGHEGRVVGDGVLADDGHAVVLLLVGDGHGRPDGLHDGADVCVRVPLHGAVGEVAPNALRLDDGAVVLGRPHQHAAVGARHHQQQDCDLTKEIPHLGHV